METEMEINMKGNSYVITEPHFVKVSIEELAKMQVDLDRMKQFILEENTIFHFNEKLKMLEDNTDDITLAWIDSGYCTIKNEPIFISLLRNKKYPECYSGYFVGTDYFLKNGLCNRAKNEYEKAAIEKHYKKFKEEYYPKYVEKRTTQHIEISDLKTSKENKPDFSTNTTISFPVKLSAVTEQIYDSLLFPNWNSISGLDRYIKIIGKRIGQIVQKNREQFYVINKIKSVIVNSGILNTWGQDNLILYRYNETYKMYIAEKVIESKQDFLDNDFSKEQSSKILQPINFFEENEKSFTPTIDEFDIDLKSLTHIIHERKERFPENLQQQSDNEIVDKIVQVLKRGIQMQMRDNSYAKAHYSGKTGRIAWLLPLHINTKLTEEPELVMLIDRTENFYKIKTVLTFDDSLKDKITSLSLYRKSW